MPPPERDERQARRRRIHQERYQGIRFAELQSVSPYQASLWLSTSPQHIEKAKVDYLVLQMADGKWRHGQERHPVVIRRGRLTNGHHRLTAVTRLGHTMQLLVLETDNRG